MGHTAVSATLSLFSGPIDLATWSQRDSFYTGRQFIFAIAILAVS